MNYRERMKEYLKEPNEHSYQYGKWAILNREQRDLIKKLLREMDGADEVIKHQYFEIERLNKELQDTKEHLGEYLYEQEEENKRLNNIINELYNGLEEIIDQGYDYNEKDCIAIKLQNRIKELKGDGSND